MGTCNQLEFESVASRAQAVGSTSVLQHCGLTPDQSIVWIFTGEPHASIDVSSRGAQYVLF